MRNEDRSISGQQGRRTFYDDVHLVINFMREVQDLCGRHPRLLLRQHVQPL